MTRSTQELATKAQTEKPLFNDVGVLGLVPELWSGDLWLGRHQVLSRLARYFNVVWCNPPLGWRELWFGAGDVSNDKGHRVPPAYGFDVYTQSSWLPRFYRPHWLARITATKRLQRARERLIGMGARKIVAYLWRPNLADALDMFDYDISCYHIADEYTFSTVERATSDIESRLIERVNQVFIHSPALFEKKGHLNPQTLRVSNGVDYDHFARPTLEPEDMLEIPHPRIGYVGRVKSQLNWNLIEELARRHKNWSFVFVGPLSNTRESRPLIENLFRLPNVYYLGAKTIAETPAYIQHLDICALWYVLDGYTKYIYPLKLHEYLASGRPVVGSPIRSLLEFRSVVRTAETVDEWSEELSSLLANAHNHDSEMDKRRSVAKEHDWDYLVALIAQALCEKLGPDYLEKFESINTLQLNGDRP